jgi:hypothetical protein
MYRIVTFVLVFLGLSATPRALMAAGVTQEAGCSAPAAEFFQQSAREQERQFVTCEFEEQYRLYIYGMRREPPAMGLASLLAKRGANVVAPLEQKLRDASDELQIFDLVLVFSDMASLKTYDVAQDSTLADLLKTKVFSMKDPKLCVKWLQESGIDVGDMP